VVHCSRLFLTASLPWRANENIWLSLHCSKQGQGELRGKPHRSNRCGDFAAYEDHQLHRREDSASSLTPNDNCQRLMLVYRVAYPWPCEIPLTAEGRAKRKKTDPGFAWKGCSKELLGTGGVPRQRCIIRLYGISADDSLGRLPPTQTKGIPGFPSKTPVAQMHFASELPLSEADRSINMAGQLMITQANLGASRKKMGKLQASFIVDKMV
jgi:hypothetical protein